MWRNFEEVLFKQRFDQAGDVGDFDDLDRGVLDGVEVGVGADEDLLEAEALGFDDAAVGLGDGADFAAEADFAGEAEVGGDGEIEVRRQYGANHREVAGRVGDLKAAGHVQEHVLRAEVEARALFQNCQKHI